MAMTTATQLSQMSLQIANEILERALQLKPELQKIKLRQVQIEAQLESAQLCHQRARNFRALIDGNLQCPGCWIRSETERALTPIGSETKDDFFRCGTCGEVIRIEIGV